MYISKLIKLGIDTFKEAKSEDKSNQYAISKVVELVTNEVPNIAFEFRPISNGTHLTNKIDRNERWSDQFIYEYVLSNIFYYFIKQGTLSILDIRGSVWIKK